MLSQLLSVDEDISDRLKDICH
jgi:N-acetylmuramic acid 6-phosphate etherase